MKQGKAAGEISSPLAARLIEFCAEGLDGLGGEGVERDSQGEGLMVVKAVEGEDLDAAIGSWGNGDGCGAGERGFAD